MTRLPDDVIVCDEVLVDFGAEAPPLQGRLIDTRREGWLRTRRRGLVLTHGGWAMWFDMQRIERA